MSSSAAGLRRDALARCATFSGLADQVLDQLAEALQKREFTRGERLMHQGEPGDALWLLTAGSAEARLEGDSEPLAKFYESDLLGEMALVTGEARTADVYALEDGAALLLPRASFEHIAATFPELGLVLTQLVSSRLGNQLRDGLGDKLIQGYRIESACGRGATAAVYRAHNQEGRIVALKMMSHRLRYEPQGRARFLREAEALRDIDHAGIARVHGILAAFGTNFIVMDFIDGRTLAEVLYEEGPMSEPEARRIVAQVADTLAHLHSRGLLHRDLKPSNVMRCEDGSIKLIDFGLAKLALPRQTSITQPGSVLGTPRYLASKQLEGSEANEASDLYSLGCLGYELVAGEPLFKSRSYFELVQEKRTFVLGQRHEIGSGVSREFHTFLAAGLADDEERRGRVMDLVAGW